MRIAIVAALPGELKQLVNRGFRRVPASAKTIHKWVSANGNDEWIATCAGMGADAARRAFAEAEADGPIHAVLSAGWAGALTDELAPATTCIASAVVDAQTGERFELSDGQRHQVLVTANHVVQEAEKHRLATTYGASLVDMESATIVRLAQMRGLPVCCVKSISDAFHHDLPDFNPHIHQGQLRMGRFLGHTARRPKTWKPLLRLGRNSAAAAHNLASALLTILNGPKDFAELNRTGNVNWEPR